ncbi:MAG: glycosyltransferase family 39 protein [Gammaproteobacteria bacterium]|nr:glycosyltransferase family 39 protein [Gammaproteobacteria bacterium]
MPRDSGRLGATLLSLLVGRWLPLALIVLLGLILRSQYFTAPLADAHRWRQIDNVTIARHFAEGPFDLLHPQVNWGGPGDASVEMEFPLLPALIAIGYLGFGESPMVARTVVIAFSLALIGVVYLIGVNLYGIAAGRGAALLIAVSPSAVYFGRIPIVDTLMVFFSAAAVLAFVRYFGTRRRRDAFIGGTALGFALLVKLPAALMLGPVAYIAWRSARRSTLRHTPFWTAILLPLFVTVTWYWHANNLYLETGLTVGIWRGAGTYPPALLPLVGPTSTFTGWADAGLLTNLEFYEGMIGRIYGLHLTPPGFVLCIVGAVVSWRSGAGVGIVAVWMLAVLSFVVVVGQGNWIHEYYQLPLLPPAALLFGLATAPVFDGNWVRTCVAGGWRGPVAVGLAVVLSAVTAFHYSGVVEGYFRPGRLDMVPIRAGAAIDRATPANGVMVVVEHAHSVNAANSPMLLYHARRRGWSFDLDSITVPAVLRLRAFGATHFATTLWAQMEAERPEVAHLLEHETEAVATLDAPADFRLFRLP